MKELRDLALHCENFVAAQFENNYFTEMCSGSEAGSYLRLINFVHHSTLGLRVFQKKGKESLLFPRSRRIESETGVQMAAVGCHAIRVRAFSRLSPTIRCRANLEHTI